MNVWKHSQQLSDTFASGGSIAVLWTLNGRNSSGYTRNLHGTWRFWYHVCCPIGRTSHCHRIMCVPLGGTNCCNGPVVGLNLGIGLLEDLLLLETSLQVIRLFGSASCTWRTSCRRWLRRMVTLVLVNVELWRWRRAFCSAVWNGPKLPREKTSRTTYPNQLEKHDCDHLSKPTGRDMGNLGRPVIKDCHSCSKEIALQ